MIKTKGTYSDLLVILIFATVTLIFVTNTELENSPIRTILGLPMVLFVPGYIMVAVFFPKKGDIDNVERIALSLGFSIVVISFLGLLLNFTFGIKFLVMIEALYIYIIVFISIAIYRRKKLPKEERFSVAFDRIYEIIENDIKQKSKIGSILTLIIIFTFVIILGMAYYMISNPKVGEKFTEFYILNSSRGADNYPTDLHLNNPDMLLVGIINNEYSSTNYTVQVALDKNVLASEKFVLNHGGTWEKNVTFVPNKVGTHMKLEFWLFRDSDFSVPYRSLFLLVNAT